MILHAAAAAAAGVPQHPVVPQPQNETNYKVFNFEESKNLPAFTYFSNHQVKKLGMLIAT